MPVRTPELDRFAERAVSLSRMYTASFPTIPHRTGLTSGRYGWPPQPFHGQSFAPILRGDSNGPLHDFAISTMFHRADQDHIATSGTTPALYTEKWAYAPIGAYRERELYDLEADPYAEVNVASEHAETVQDLHERLLGWLRGVGAPQEAIDPFT